MNDTHRVTINMRFNTRSFSDVDRQLQRPKMSPHRVPSFGVQVHDLRTASLDKTTPRQNARRRWNNIGGFRAGSHS